MVLACEICGNPKRKLRFQTIRLSICQWCVTELSYSLDSPADVLARARAGFMEKRILEFESKAQVLVSQSIPPPIYPDEELSLAASVALNKVRSTEGFLISAYRTLVDNHGRIEQAKVEEATLRRAIHAKFTKDLELCANHSEVLNSSQRTRLEELRFELESGVEADMVRYLGFRLGTGRTKFKATRLLRANSLGILSTEKSYVRRLESSVVRDTNATIRRQDGSKCVVCQKSGAGIVLHVHHIIPLSQFGTNHENNLATVCFACHCKQHPEIDMSEISNFDRD